MISSVSYEHERRRRKKHLLTTRTITITLSKLTSTYSVNIRMDKGNVVIANNDISEGRKSFLYSLNSYFFGQRVANMLEFLVSGGVGDQKTILIADAKTSDNSNSSNGGVNNGYNVAEFSFKHTRDTGDELKLGGQWLNMTIFTCKNFLSHQQRPSSKSWSTRRRHQFRYCSRIEHGQP